MLRISTTTSISAAFLAALSTRLVRGARQSASTPWRIRLHNDPSSIRPDSRQYPDRADFREQRINSLFVRGFTHSEEGNYEAAEVDFEKTVSLLRDLIESKPVKCRKARLNLAGALVNFRNVLDSQRKYDEAKSVATETVKVAEELASDYPDSYEEQSRLVSAFDGLRVAIHRADPKSEEMLAVTRRGLQLAGTLVDRFPNLQTRHKYLHSALLQIYNKDKLELRDEDEIDHILAEVFQRVSTWPRLDLDDSLTSYRIGYEIRRLLQFRAGRLLDSGLYRDAATTLATAWPHTLQFAADRSTGYGEL